MISMIWGGLAVANNKMTLDEEISILTGERTSTPNTPEFDDMRIDHNQELMNQMERDFNPNDYDNSYDPNFPEIEGEKPSRFMKGSYTVDIDSMLANLAESEGGWANNPNDDGGPTMRGITLKTYQKYVNPKATIKELKKLSQEQANQIYVKEYYYGMGVDKLPAELQELVFDMNVLHGPGNAGKIVQRALRDTGNPIKVDGVIGDKTRGIISSMDPEKLKIAINSERENFIYDIVRAKPEKREFLSGWLTRINKFKGENNV